MGLHSKRPSLSCAHWGWERGPFLAVAATLCGDGCPAGGHGEKRALARLSFEKVLVLLEGFVRRRIAAAAVLAVGLALGTAGCTFTAPQSTLIKYNASDGVSLNVGKIQLRNAFVISPKGTDSNFIGVLINTGKSTVEVEFQYTTHTGGAATSAEFDQKLTPGQVVSFGNPGVKQKVFRAADVKPGALLKVFVQYGSVQGKNVLLPVLNGSQSYYSGLAPSPVPKPSDTPTPLPTATSQPN
jgi:hypothetical protein